jgi:hypothetical protein
MSKRGSKGIAARISRAPARFNPNPRCGPREAPRRLTFTVSCACALWRSPERPWRFRTALSNPRARLYLGIRHPHGGVEPVLCAVIVQRGFTPGSDGPRRRGHGRRARGAHGWIYPALRRVPRAGAKPRQTRYNSVAAWLDGSAPARPGARRAGNRAWPSAAKAPTPATTPSAPPRAKASYAPGVDLPLNPARKHLPRAGRLLRVRACRWQGLQRNPGARSRRHAITEWDDSGLQSPHLPRCRSLSRVN